MNQTKLVSINQLSERDLMGILDYTFLQRPESYGSREKGESAVRLRERAFHGFLDEVVAMKTKPYAVCVRPEDVTTTLERVGATGVRIASVVGFPDGSHYRTGFKVAETKLAIGDGAKEIDMVMDYEALKSGDVGYVMGDVDLVVKEAHKHGALLKLILETSELTQEQIAQACRIADDLGVDFVKTSTGFSSYGARVEDVRTMRANFKRGIKISGGVTPNNVVDLLLEAASYDDSHLNLDPNYVRIGSSRLIPLKQSKCEEAK